MIGWSEVDVESTDDIRAALARMGREARLRLLANGTQKLEEGRPLTPDEHRALRTELKARLTL